MMKRVFAIPPADIIRALLIEVKTFWFTNRREALRYRQFKGVYLSQIRLKRARLLARTLT
jgi:hypothetical protein